MLFSITKTSRKVIFVSGDIYGRVELICMSQVSINAHLCYVLNTEVVGALNP